MKRRVKALSLAVLMLLTTVVTVLADTAVVRAEDLVIKLHYHREDDNYEGWDVWMWEVGGEGGGYAFEEVDGEMVASKVVTPGISSVGFIVRTADWTKDVDMDQFIDISEMVSGEVHIYVESGVEGYTKEYGENAVTGTKLSSAKYDGEGAVTVVMTGAIEGDLNSAFTVKGSDGTVGITEVTEAGQFTYTVSLAEPLDASGTYSITYDGNDYNIIIPSIYSTPEFEAEYTYNGDDLGATWSAEKTTFRVWAPTAQSVTLNLYESGTPDTDDRIEEIPMTADVNGTWVAEKSGDLNGVYYTYSVNVNNTVNEACDPYARTTGVNGKRAMVIDLASTNPENWDSDGNPNAGMNYTDAVIYELHVRDLSVDDSSGISNKGKFLGLIETGTTTESGIPTGLDHIKDLGITHLHLLPSYDYGSVDETKLDKPQFNWGYDPVNYNVPEGSYSTDPYHGEVRVNEMKQMVQGLHENNISVVMDVVYNHVQSASDFCFNQIVPGYFSRIDDEGKYSSGSGCGNDTASERAMVKKYIVDSVNYWADEYHIDGFRFDLVGLIDTETMNEVIETVHQDHPDVIFYGEGWTMDTTLTKEGYTMTTQVNSTEVPGMAFFSDTIRDGLKGNVFNVSEPGFISGAQGLESTITDCFMGQATGWCTTPSQSVNYASCHDNLTMIDRITRSTPSDSREDRIRMNNLAAVVYMTAEGIPFLQAGEEMLRTKVTSSGGFDENSYASPDEVNSLKWDDLNQEEYMNVYNYYKGLIAFRKAHGVLRLTTAEDVNEHVTPVEGMDANVVAFDITGGINGETAEGIYVVFNANKEEKEISLPEGSWNVCINDTQAGTEAIETVSGKVTVAPISAMVLVKDGTMAAGDGSSDHTADTGRTGTNPWGALIFVVVLTAALIGAAVLQSKRKRS